jgi:hypothetical protein
MPTSFKFWPATLVQLEAKWTNITIDFILQK